MIVTTALLCEPPLAGSNQPFDLTLAISYPLTTIWDQATINVKRHFLIGLQARYSLEQSYGLQQTRQGRTSPEHELDTLSLTIGPRRHQLVQDQLIDVVG
jgi:hypothetical protein